MILYLCISNILEFSSLDNFTFLKVWDWKNSFTCRMIWLVLIPIKNESYYKIHYMIVLFIRISNILNMKFIKKKSVLKYVIEIVLNLINF